jgi:hypothetical protein
LRRQLDQDLCLVVHDQPGDIGVGRIGFLGFRYLRFGGIGGRGRRSHQVHSVPGKSRGASEYGLVRVWLRAPWCGCGRLWKFRLDQRRSVV